MSEWFRIFGTNDVQPEPGALLEYLHGLGVEVEGHFHGDEQGWFQADLIAPDARAVLKLERFLAKEEGIRAELNTWAAWLETADHNPNHAWLMRHMISTTQLFTLQQSVGQAFQPDGGEIELGPSEKLCLAVCQFLAHATAGVYQVDNQGLFAPDGALLLQEE
jgi:hypothetical protein